MDGGKTLKFEFRKQQPEREGYVAKLQGGGVSKLKGGRREEEGTEGRGGNHTQEHQELDAAASEKGSSTDAGKGHCVRGLENIERERLKGGARNWWWLLFPLPPHTMGNATLQPS